MRARFLVFAFPLAALLLGRPASAGLDSGSYSGRGFAPVGDTRLFYEVKGSGDPVVLIHGGQLDSRMWDDQFELYAREFRVLSLVLSGPGVTGLDLESPEENARYLREVAKGRRP